MPRAKKACGSFGCPERVVGRTYCPEHRAERDRRANTTQRGYGAEHQALRATWAPIVEAGGVQCWRCHEEIAPGSPWDLGHSDDDRGTYRGPEHRRCNRATSTRR
jgi:hypothetical protein